jgi:hypothetical protein
MNRAAHLGRSLPGSAISPQPGLETSIRLSGYPAIRLSAENTITTGARDLA